MPVRKDPTVLKRMVIRIVSKDGDLSRAYAIATAQAQRMGFLKAGTRDLTAKGRQKEASYTREEHKEAEESIQALIAYFKSHRGEKVDTSLPKKRRKIGLAPPALSATAYGLTDIGKVRTNNEDAFLVTPNLWVVSDGIGGAEGGETASAACVAGARAALKTDAAGENLLEDAVKKALSKMPSGFRGGATMVSATVVGMQLVVGNIGDSRAYLMSAAGKVTRLTRDHQERGNVLNRWVGPRSPKLGEVDLELAKLEPGSRLLLCSDGVYGLISEADLRLALRTAKTPKAACDRLVKEALAAGGNDNATAIVVFFGAKGRTGSRAKAQPKTPAKRAKAPARAKAPKAPAKGAKKTPAPRTPRATQAPARGSLASMRPMLAKVFTGMKPGHAYVAEPKIDGYRLLAKRTASGVTLETRTGHKEPYTTNLRTIRAALAKSTRPGDVIDGEIIVTDWAGTGLVRKDRLSETEQKALDKKAMFWIFDMPSVGGSYKERRKALVALDMYKGSLRLVPSVAVVDVADANRVARKMAAAGYEGAIIKDTGAPYSFGKRTDAFTKIKFKHDITATITGFEEGSGKNAGSLGALRVRWDGKDFKVGTGFSDAQRDDVWRNKKKYLGKKVEVTAQKDGAKLKLPRFPAFVRFRGNE